MVKFSFEETVEYFNQCGFWVLDEYIEDIHIGDKLNIQDSGGYRYYVSRHLLSSKVGVGKKDYTLQRYAVQNPYTIDNIILWMQNNNCSFTFHHGEYKGNDVPSLFFQCNKSGHIWDTFWSLIQRGCGCPYCNGKRISDMRNLGTERPDLISEWDNNKNEGSIFEITPRSRKNYWWVCSKCGHNWEATASNRNALTKEKSSNCPKCCRSSGELEVERILNIYNIKYFNPYRFKKCKYKNTLSFDFYLPDYNCCIEFNGKQHYENVVNWKRYFILPPERFKQQKIRDEIKKQFCLKEGILFIIIPYWDIDNIKEILSDQLQLIEIS